MNIPDMLEQSGILTLFGMGVVFGFLIIMVIVITVTGKIINKSIREENIQPAVSIVQRQVETDAITAAICAAVNEYRKNKYK